MMRELQSNSLLFGSNAPFIEELYEQYLSDPASVSEQWRDYFDALQRTPGATDRDVAHYPVIAAFAEMAKRPPVRTVTTGEDKRQVSTLQLIRSEEHTSELQSPLN